VRLILRTIACVGVAGLASIAACSGGSSGDGKTIRIGVDLPLSGDEGQAGIPTLNGVRFYIHQHPAIQGFNVEVSARDDAVRGVHDAKQGAQNFSDLIADPQVMGIIGPFNASVARAAIPLANVAHLAVISPATSNVCLTRDPDLPAGLNPTRAAIGCKAAGLPLPTDLRPTRTNNFFRLATTDDLQGPAAADYAFNTLHLLRVGVLSDREVFGQALAAGFRARFTRLGGLVVAYQDFTPSASLDLSSFFKQTKADGGQAVYFGGTTANQGCAIRAQMAAAFGASAAVPYLGGSGIAQDPACVRAAGGNAAGIYATVPVADADQVAASQPAITAFKAQYRNAWDYGAYTIPAYDATAVLYAALDRAITDAGGKLPARQAVTEGVGADKTVGFDAAGDTTHRVVSIYEATSSDPATPWRYAGAVDYSAKLPY
jgi:branched-chain amino acid transport system substrate-binding protein